MGKIIINGSLTIITSYERQWAQLGSNQ